MCRILVFLLLISLQDIWIQCYMPILTVQRMDTKLIKRKRQDTRDMCRIFNAENESLKNMEIASTAHRRTIKSSDVINMRSRPKREVDDFDDMDHGESITHYKRSKRDAYGSPNPLVNLEDMRRVENIVDKLYDDADENGTKPNYRQPLKSMLATTKMVTTKKSGRRFDFAPALLLGPDLGPPTGPNTPDPGLHVQVWRKRWPHGIIPYFVDPKTYDNLLVDQIRRAFDYFERATCIRLQRLREKPRDRESMENVEWVYITNPGGIRQCVHSNERKLNKGVQVVVFGYDCLSMGEIVHEVMHILGFSHEHTRPDRDRFVFIEWNNIKPGYKKYFSLREEDSLIHLPYDYASILHYPQRAFSKNGQVTIKTEGDIKFGQRDALSDIDIEKVSLIYGIECMNRNKEYLLTTCPSVVKKREEQNATEREVKDYFRDRVWEYGVINYKIRDVMEFSAEERENIQAVIRHIEKETCIEFRDVGTPDGEHSDEAENSGKTDPLDNLMVYNITHIDDRITDTENRITDTEHRKTDTESRIPDIESRKTDTESRIPDIENRKTDTESRITDSENRITDTETEASGRRSIILVDGDEGGYSNRVKRDIRRPLSPSRRHATNILTLTRSAELGCKCPDKPGKPEGDGTLPIYSDCFNSVNDLLHLFVHVLGLDHQHNMHDRDSYLYILWDNLTPSIKADMQNKLPPAAAAGFPYDYQSVMHYPWLEIKNGLTNIMYPIWNDGWAMGHWQGLSSIDVQKINKIYSEQCLRRKEAADKPK